MKNVLVNQKSLPEVPPHKENEGRQMRRPAKKAQEYRQPKGL